ncbi:hypothetical protein NQ317_014540 [Molorchus minor]|uniref:Ig-like domain-containing protein n=1 Tax=Molorchus minor TaxID=1323400 RepID=A0ABQ9J2F3_9CUCU|nr:hypothetical protein NQ317_014540 [Molorchus minor]
MIRISRISIAADGVVLRAPVIVKLCNPESLVLVQVSWVRRRDWHILSSGVFTYTNDERFQILHAEGSDDWTLQIKYVQKRDNGTYECQAKEPNKTNVAKFTSDIGQM